MEGCPAIMWPQLNMNSEGSWNGRSTCIERITQMSSACAPSFGKISLNSVPLLPQRSKLEGGFQQIAGQPLGLQVSAGAGVP